MGRLCVRARVGRCAPPHTQRRGHGHHGRGSARALSLSPFLSLPFSVPCLCRALCRAFLFFALPLLCLSLSPVPHAPPCVGSSAAAVFLFFPFSACVFVLSSLPLSPPLPRPFCLVCVFCVWLGSTHTHTVSLSLAPRRVPVLAHGTTATATTVAALKTTATWPHHAPCFLFALSSAPRPRPPPFPPFLPLSGGTLRGGERGTEERAAGRREAQGERRRGDEKQRRPPSILTVSHRQRHTSTGRDDGCAVVFCCCCCGAERRDRD